MLGCQVIHLTPSRPAVLVVWFCFAAFSEDRIDLKSVMVSRPRFGLAGLSDRSESYP